MKQGDYWMCRQEMIQDQMGLLPNSEPDLKPCKSGASAVETGEEDGRDCFICVHHDVDDHKLALNGWRYESILRDIMRTIRHALKYNDGLSPGQLEVYEEIAQEIRDDLEYHGLRIEV